MTYIDDATELADRLETAGSPDDARTVRQLINTLTAGLDVRSPDHALATVWQTGSGVEVGEAQAVDLARGKAVAQIAVTSTGFMIRVFPEGALVRFGGNNVTALCAIVDTQNGGAKLTSFSFDEVEPNPVLASPKPERKHAYTELLGHGLQNEGDSFHPDGTRTFHIAGRGHGLCSCGILSPELTSNYQRKAWHRQHKAAIKESA
jgi:hypothetical protein